MTVAASLNAVTNFKRACSCLESSKRRCARSAMALRNVTVCAGVSGSGKSTFVCRLLVNGDYSTVYLFDPEPGEFDPNIGEYAGRLGLQRARDAWELNLALCRGWVPFDPHTLFPGRMKEALIFLCDWAWETSVAIPGEKIIVIDEVWLY